MDEPRRAVVQEMVKTEPPGWQLPPTVKLEDYPEHWADEILPVAREAHQRLVFSGVRPQTDKGETFAIGAAGERQMPDRIPYHEWPAKIVREELHKAGWRLADLLEHVLE